nr:hypothetical protein [Paenibacillus xylanexedens]
MEWTPRENAKIVGILPDYRDSLSQNPSVVKVSEYYARELIKNSLNIFNDRINKVVDPVDTIAQHIRRMDDVVAGRQLQRPLMADEHNWANCYK